MGRRRTIWLSVVAIMVLPARLLADPDVIRLLDESRMEASADDLPTN